MRQARLRTNGRDHHRGHSHSAARKNDSARWIDYRSTIAVFDA
jgi:hypothetical protein